MRIPQRIGTSYGAQARRRLHARRAAERDRLAQCALDLQQLSGGSAGLSGAEGRHSADAHPGSRSSPSLTELKPRLTERIAGFDRSSPRMTTLVSIFSGVFSGVAHPLRGWDTVPMILLRAIYYTVGAFGLALGLVFLPQIIERFAAAPHVALLFLVIAIVLYALCPWLNRVSRPNPWRRSWWR